MVSQYLMLRVALGMFEIILVGVLIFIGGAVSGYCFCNYQWKMLEVEIDKLDAAVTELERYNVVEFPKKEKE